MLVLDRDVLVKLRNSDDAVVQHLQQYSTEEWTIPAHVAWESFQYHDSRTDMQQERRLLEANFDRILSFTDQTALEAAYLDERLASQGVRLDAVGLLNLAAAYENGGTFVTHNRQYFGKPPIRQLADVDVVPSA